MNGMGRNVLFCCITSILPLPTYDVSLMYTQCMLPDCYLILGIFCFLFICKILIKIVKTNVTPDAELVLKMYK